MRGKTGQGCQTCKIRRVKCDRAIPSCNKCVTTGRTCDGKQRQILPDQQLIKRLAVKPIDPLTDERNLPTFSFHVTDFERHAFEMFRKYMVWPMTLVSPDPEWVYLALQLSSTSHITFQAIAAHIDYGKAILKEYSEAPLKVSLQSCHSMIMSMDRWSLDHVQIITPQGHTGSSWPHSLSSKRDAYQTVKALIADADKLMQERLDWAERHINDLSLGLNHGPHFCLIRSISRMANHILKDHQVDRLKKVRNLHAYWCGPLLEAKSTPETPADLLLAIQLLLSDLLLSMCDSEDERTEHCIPHFERTLDLMSLYLKRWPECIMMDPPTFRHTGREAQISFSLDPEVLPALNMMAYRCRDQALRRRIIQLMYKMKRREGTNYSVALADGCRWLADIEEHRAEKLGLPCKIVPDEVRSHEVVIVHEIGCLKLVTTSVIRRPGHTAVEINTYAGGGDPMPLKPVKTQTIPFRKLGFGTVG
ncbi:hypothetical protein BDZ85DRAFT_44209 [Elsinoe ampelina]|uniref:Zn(2)-C6 fungal-type domain-containing protein n=1 Tax=Elsinoe ampelina TaxID=302913 RepID=A0A6A6G1X2_9PEZI|nr:hypothetical protein BDZ85DRAFT_44209 [Elsinoe ampelina]